MAIVGEPLPDKPTSHMGASSCPRCSSSDSAPCYWTEKASQDGPSAWATAPAEEAWK